MRTPSMKKTAAVAAVPLVSTLLLAAFSIVPLPASAQNSAPAEKSANSERKVTGEELEKAYLQLPEAKLPTPRTPD